tara:strand:- start:1176 stop:1787 length:612 start_codon:yes stop_codon:yes gene_type:complete
MPYKTTKNRLVNEVTLGDGYPLSNNLLPLKIGGETSPLEMSKQLPDQSDKAKVKVVGDLEVTGSIIKQPTLHFMNGGASTTSANLFYLPLVGYNVELTTSTGRNEYLSFVTPYDGILKKVVLRSENRCDTVVVGFHKSAEGTEIPNGTATEEQSQEMPIDDTTHTFNFTESTFVAGDIINISVNADIAVGDTVWTVVLEYKGV